MTLEDLDPFRDCHGWPVTGRLSSDETRAWQLWLNVAWRRLAATVPAYADVLAAGLRCVVVPNRFTRCSRFGGAIAVLDDVRALPALVESL